MGIPAIGADSTQLLALIFAHNDAKAFLLPRAKMTAALAARGNNSALLFMPRTELQESTALSVDWLGSNNARAHLADVPRLDGLRLAMPGCTATIRRLDRAGANASEDLAKQVKVTMPPLYPQLAQLPAQVDFRTAQAAAVVRDVGWYHWQDDGSWTSGDAAAIGFRLPSRNCHAGEMSPGGAPVPGAVADEARRTGAGQWQADRVVADRRRVHGRAQPGGAGDDG